jgi:hypothetical protein
MNLSDRHADGFIRTWLALTEPMSYDGLNIGHALKRTFYADWLKPGLGGLPRPRSAVEKLTAHYSAARLRHTGPAAADILILQQGQSAREAWNWEGFQEQLSAHARTGVAASVRTNLRTISGWQQLWTNRRRHYQVVRRALRDLRSYREVVPAVRQSFDLPAQFEDWFWYEMEGAVWYWANARMILEEVRPKVMVSAGDNQPNGYLFHMAARQCGIPSVVLQHGFIGQEWVFYPLWAETVCVWGDVEKQWYVDRGVAPERVAVTGTVRGLTELPLENRAALRTRLGCRPDQLCAIWLTTPHGGEWTERLWQWLNDPRVANSPHRLVLKLHPKEKKTTYAMRIPDSIGCFSTEELDLASVFAAADVVIHDHSSVGAEAQFCGQNAICAGVNPPYPDYYEALTEGQVRVDDPQQLAAQLDRQSPPTLKSTSVPGLTYGGAQAGEKIVQTILEVMGG